MATAFGDGAFKHLIDWMRNKLHINLDICAVDSHVPRAENAIRLVKDWFRSVQYETPFKIS